MLKNKISVTMLTKNSQVHIKECLNSLALFDEVILLDNGSSDDTLKIAKSFTNIKIFKSEFIGFGPLKNLALSYTKNNWVLSIDSDEVLTKELLDEINLLKLDKNSIYSIKRDNYYNKKLIKCCGWDKDYVNRLFDKNRTRFNDNQVHESLIIDSLKIQKLKNSMAHYSFENASELIDKIQRYSTLYAKDYKGKKTSSPLKAFIRASFAFFKFYILKKGFLNGYEGLVISVSNANGVFYKYIKLYEENR